MASMQRPLPTLLYYQIPLLLAYSLATKLVGVFLEASGVLQLVQLLRSDGSV